MVPTARALLVASAFLFVTTDVHAGRSFAYSDHDDAALRELVASLAVDVGGGRTVVLARTALYELRRFDGSRTENRVFEVGVDVPSSPLVIDVDPDLVTGADAWILRADSGDIHRFEGEVEADVRFDVSTLEPGDVFGWTVTSDYDHGLQFERVMLCDRWPVLRTRIHVKTARNLDYRVDPIHGVDANVDVVERDPARGDGEWFQVDAQDLPATRDAILAPHRVEYEPHLRIVRVGRFYPEHSMWIRSSDWDLWAALELGRTSDWIDASFEVQRAAFDVTARDFGDDERADAIYRWVTETIELRRDPFPSSAFERASVAMNLDLVQIEEELAHDEGVGSFYGRRLPMDWTERRRDPGEADIGSWRRSFRVRSFAELVAAGEANAVERTAVMASMLDVLGIEYLIGFARDARLGTFDFTVAGRWQVTDLVIGLVDVQNRVVRWYCLTDDVHEAGLLPPTLSGVSIAFVSPRLGETMDRLWTQAWTAADGEPTRVLNRYVDTIARQTIVRFVVAPEMPPSPVDREHVVIRYGTDGRPTETVGIEDARAVTPPEGGEPWAIDTAVAYPTNPLAAWDGADRPPVRIDRTVEYRWSIELPIPDGWNGVAHAEPFALDHSALNYRTWRVVGEQSIVLERQLVLNRGTASGEALVDLGTTIDAMRDHERRPVVLTAGAR